MLQRQTLTHHCCCLSWHLRTSIAVFAAAIAISLEDEVSIQWIMVASPHSADSLESAAAAAGAVTCLLCKCKAQLCMYEVCCVCGSKQCDQSGEPSSAGEHNALLKR
jgi:hypothetical protein